MALLFADAVAKYNAEKNSEKTSVNELTNKVADFLDDIDDIKTPEQYNFVPDNSVKQNMPQTIFMASIASEYYSKAKDDIANTKVGNKAVRKKNFKQVMQESFFYGSNRFGTNFIA